MDNKDETIRNLCYGVVALYKLFLQYELGFCTLEQFKSVFRNCVEISKIMISRIEGDK